MPHLQGLTLRLLTVGRAGNKVNFTFARALARVSGSNYKFNQDGMGSDAGKECDQEAL